MSQHNNHGQEVINEDVAVFNYEGQIILAVIPFAAVIVASLRVSGSPLEYPLTPATISPLAEDPSCREYAWPLNPSADSLNAPCHAP